MTHITEEEVLKNIPALPDFQSIELTEVYEGRIAFCFTAPSTLANYHGDVHGGLVYTLCEIAAGMVGTTLGKDNVALNGSVNYLRRCPVGAPVVVTCSTSHNGRSTMVAHATITNGKGRLVAESTFTLFVLSEA